MRHAMKGYCKAHGTTSNILVDPSLCGQRDADRAFVSSSRDGLRFSRDERHGTKAAVRDDPSPLPPGSFAPSQRTKRQQGANREQEPFKSSRSLGGCETELASRVPGKKIPLLAQH